jgi:hypothetical protein
VIPREWKTLVEAQRARNRMTDAAAWVAENRYQLIECDDNCVAGIQELMNLSYRNVWTRDRGKPNKVPCGYEVRSLFDMVVV